MTTTRLTWNLSQELLFMKALFCVETNFLEISEESRLLLNLWAYHYFPRQVFSHTEIFEQYHSEFQKDPAAFFTHFFAQVKSCELSHKQKIEIINTISVNISNGFQFYFVKIVHDYFFATEQSKMTIAYNLDLFSNVNQATFNTIQEQLILPHTDRFNLIEFPSFTQTWSTQWLEKGDFTLALDVGRMLDF